ncbi:GNAT family N-acetyltransferase [Fibrella arboris]|uniref:GNAT family N-acetyltransferase n=1 Tax=Fibrella arboris TaxID=3242486 RepID=UPI0035219B48
MQSDSNSSTTGATGDPKSGIIRSVTPDDVPALKALIDTVDLFPSAMLDDMMTDYLTNPASSDCWLTDTGLAGVAYYAPERLTEGTWNLYLIAIHPDRQGQGRGAALIRYVEQALRERGERLLLVETSGLPKYEYQRAFYRRCGYVEEARIRDFYQAGEDKVVFWKALTPKNTVRGKVS